MTDQEDGQLAGEAVVEIVENQIADNNPPRVKETLMRLMLQESIEREEAIRYIACALCVELVDVLNNKAAFNAERYNSNLDLLPEMPWEEEL